MNIKIRIEGTTPLLMHRFTDEAAMKATSGNGAAQVGGTKSPQESAAESLYVTETGEVIIPQPNLFRCIMDAGTFFKAGKSKVTTQKSSLIPACLAMGDPHYPLLFEQPWKVDTRPVRIPSTGGRILRHRPCFEDWAVEFEVGLDTVILAPKLLREIVDAAGSRIGLGDFRPATKGPFGRFVVTSWVEDE
jgi:hypothetical protein